MFGSNSWSNNNQPLTFFLPCCLYKTTQITNQFHLFNHLCSTLPSAEVSSHNHFAAHRTASVVPTADNVSPPSSNYKMNLTHTLSLSSSRSVSILSPLLGPLSPRSLRQFRGTLYIKPPFYFRSKGP